MSPLRECLESVWCNAPKARQVQQRIRQHRAVTGGQDETVAIRPHRIGWVELEETRKQHRGAVSHAHRHARMTRLRFFDRIDRQKAYGIGQFWMRDIRTTGE